MRQAARPMASRTRVLALVMAASALAAVAIGAYDPPEMMRMTHTTPEESLDIFADVRARTFVAMHWGTFDLAEEPLDEPPRRLRKVAKERGIPDERVWVLKHGETRAW